MNERAISLCNQGHVCMQARKYEDALKLFDQAIAIEGRYALAWANKAAAMGNLNRPKEMRQCLEQALSIDPEHPDVLYTAGWVLAKEGNHADAVYYYDQSIAAYENKLRVASLLARSYNMKAVSLLQIGKCKEALASWDKAIAVSDDVAEKTSYRFNMAMVCRQMGDHQRCIKLLEAVIDANGRDAEAFMIMALSYMELGAEDKAANCIQQAASIDPTIIQRLSVGKK
jgi:tetratricopeptide (TPR) repeat protein